MIVNNIFSKLDKAIILNYDKFVGILVKGG